MKRLVFAFILCMIASSGVFAQDSLKVHIKGSFPKSVYKIYWLDKIYELHTKEKRDYFYTFWVIFPDSVKDGDEFSFKIENRRNRFSMIKTKNLIINNFSNTKKYFFLINKLDSLGNDIGFHAEWSDSISDAEMISFAKGGYYNFDTIRPYYLPNITYDNKEFASGKKIIRRRNAKHYKNNGLVR